jgi:hypothetical protein
MTTYLKSFYEYFKSILNPTQSNFQYVGTSSSYIPKPPRINLLGVEQHKRAVLHSMSRNLYTYQVEYILSEKTRSVLDQASLEADFWRGDIPYHKVNKDAHYQAAVKFTADRFRPPQLCRPVHLLDIEHHYPSKNSSNAEAPFSTEKFFYHDQLNDPVYRERHSLPENPARSFGNMKSIIFDWTRRWLHEIKDGEVPLHKYMYYILLHTKTTLIDLKDANKIRTIWGFPRPANLAYIVLLWSYMAHLKRYPGCSPLLWGYETITGGWFRLNAELFSSYMRNSIVTLDKSAFDKYFLFQILDDVENITRSFLDFNNGYIPTQEYSHTDENWLRDGKPARMERLWQFVCFTFRHAPITLHDGKMYTRSHAGMPSGVYTTQLYDTMYFCITNATTLLHMGYDLNQLVLYKGEGDDIIFKLSVTVPPNQHSLFLETYAEIDTRLFGSLIKPAKSEIHNTPQNVEVLGYRNNHGMPQRDPLDLIAQLYHTKMTRPTPAKTMATAVGIAYASMGQHRPTYNICKELFEYYAQQGYTPDERAFTLTFYQDVLSQVPLSPTAFPSITQIRQHLMDYNYNQPSSMTAFWPDWFLTDY